MPGFGRAEHVFTPLFTKRCPPPGTQRGRFWQKGGQDASSLERA